MLPSNSAVASHLDAGIAVSSLLPRFSFPLRNLLDDRAVTDPVLIPLLFPLVILHIPPMFLAIPYTACVRVSLPTFWIPISVDVSLAFYQ